ncbi:hypothetical protein [Shimia sediminis]|uniref:hypothetical protein n=1 Tax=Shimia sediminis TaxID=2497945 RepID=UPI000F8F28C6|nr:hypothetical protein [Shimia sediminis]
MSYLRSRFPGLHKQIEASRKQNAVLAEICDDLEALAALYDRTETEMDAQAKQDVLDSIRGLENEISTLFEPTDQ